MFLLFVVRLCCTQTHDLVFLSDFVFFSVECFSGRGRDILDFCNSWLYILSYQGKKYTCVSSCTNIYVSKKYERVAQVYNLPWNMLLERESFCFLFDCCLCSVHIGFSLVVTVVIDRLQKFKVCFAKLEIDFYIGWTKRTKNRSFFSWVIHYVFANRLYLTVFDSKETLFMHSACRKKPFCNTSFSIQDSIQFWGIIIQNYLDKLLMQNFCIWRRECMDNCSSKLKKI